MYQPLRQVVRRPSLITNFVIVSFGTLLIDPIH